jgi:tRNA G18 (ribose-2'-O)-methylase SpoU
MITQKPEICLALNNIRSTHNVGSIFRTADGVGIKKIYICGVSPSPVDRFGRERKDLAKVALGAEKNMEWEYIKEIKDLIEIKKKQGFEIFALEQNDNSVDYKDVKIVKDTLIILGEETKGIDKEILNMCNKIVEIPMKGNKESLNVSVASGVLLYRLLDK